MKLVKYVCKRIVNLILGRLRWCHGGMIPRPSTTPLLWSRIRATAFHCRFFWESSSCLPRSQPVGALAASKDLSISPDAR